MSKYLCVILTCLCVFFRGTAQEVPFRHYTTDDGLPSNTVYEIYRDSKGYLWFATDKGIARYNGLRFDVFTTVNGLPDNEIFFFQEDSQKRLWLATFNGELCYFKNDTFHNASNTPFLKLPGKTSFVRKITPQRDGSVVICFYDTQLFVEVRDQTCKVIKLNDLRYQASGKYEPYQHIGYPGKLSDSTYSVPGIRNDLVINDKGQILSARRSRVDSNAKYIHGFDRHNNIYYITDSGVYSGDGLKLKKKLGVAFWKNNYCYRVITENGFLFVATSNGLFVSDTTTTALDIKRVLFPGTKVSGIEYDNEGSYWIGTLGQGAYSVPVAFADYSIYSQSYGGSATYAMSAKQRVFFATDNCDLFEFRDRKTNPLINYRQLVGSSPEHAVQPSFLITDDLKYYNISGNRLVLVDDLFFPRGVHVLNNTCTEGGIKNMVVSGRTLYAQARERITRMDFLAPRSGKGEYSINCRKLKQESYDAVRISCFGKDEHGNMWYSTVDKMYRLIDDNSVEQPRFRNRALRNFIFVDGNLVGYTHNNVLLHFSAADGFSRSDTVNSQDCIWENFYRLDSSHVLISTNSEYRILTLYNDGKYSVLPLENPYVPLKAEAICSDGYNSFFFTSGQIHSIRNSELFKSDVFPQVFFTTVRTKQSTYSGQNEIFLSYQESRSLRISFSSISFNSRRVSYQYSISEKNGGDNWTDIKGDEINLVNIAYGDNAVKIRAKTGGSDYSQGSPLVLHIGRPFWATWWFVMLVLAFISLVIWLLVKRKVAIELKAKEKEHQTNVRFLKSEYKALNALMNPHFIFNTLNNVQGLVNRNDKRAANEYLRIFADLIRQNMHNVASELIPIEKEITLVSNYLLLEKLRFKENLHYSIYVDPEIDVTEIFIPPLLIQPLVENSIKHGILPMESENGFVELRVCKEGETLLIYVRNNGLPISKSRPVDPSHTSFALKNIKERIEQLSVIQNKKITFEIYEEEVDEVIWTIVLLRIPLT